MFETLTNLGTAIGTLGLAVIAFLSIKAEQKERKASEQDRKTAQKDRDNAEERQRQNEAQLNAKERESDAHRVTWWTSSNAADSSLSKFVGRRAQRI